MSTKMKIAFFSVFPLECGWGLEKYFIEISNNLRSRFWNEIKKISIINLDNHFYEKTCRVISLSQFYKIYPTYREKSHEIQKKLSGVSWQKTTLWELGKLLNSFDVIYTKNEILELILLKKIDLSDNVKVIAGVHTAPYYPIAKSLSSKVHNILYSSFLYRFLARRVNVFHVINSFDEQLLRTQFSDKEIRKIYNPFDFHEFKKRSKKLEDNFKFDEGRFNIAWIGRLTEQKGVDDLLKVIEYMDKTESGKMIAWNIVWEWDLMPKLKQMASKYKNIHLFGHVDQKYIPSILNRNDLFISTSKWEWFPYNVLEAQSFSLPVIAYDIHGINDIIDNDVNGKLVTTVQDFCREIQHMIECPEYFKNRDILAHVSSKFDFIRTYDEIFHLLTR